ncbi:hypothetical protein [Endozoicomonas sp. ONNA1]|uniref:hypothetical protein n=1 Tax=Endozoicomonas sp. ONNA1 TaxID=2828740 RepID=UPI002148B983|nr:hypothetical protein [Endozoicomonas sp. ONNA1]
MDSRSSGIGPSHSHHLNSTSMHDSQTSEEQISHGVGSIQLPNRLQKGNRPITTAIGNRDIARVEVGAPSIPKPFSMVCRASVHPISPVPEHTLFRLRESIRPETVEKACRKTRLQMAERVSRLHDELGWRFKVPANSEQTECALGDNNGHIMTLAMARSMIHQIEVMENGVADAITANGQSKEAWKRGLLQRHKLEKMHREVLALAEFYCQQSPGLTHSEEISIPQDNDPFRDLDVIFSENSLGMPPLVPKLATPRPPDGPALSPQSFELSRAQQELSGLRTEKEALGSELQQTRKQLAELTDEVEALKQKEGKVPVHFSERLSELEKEHTELRDELKQRDHQLRQKQHRIVNIHDSSVESRELSSSETPDPDDWLGELEAVNRQLQVKMNEQNQQLVENGVTISQLQTQIDASGQQIDSLQSQLQAAHQNHQQLGQQAVSALEQKNQLALQLQQEYLDSYRALENDLEQERARLAELQRSYQNAEERVADLFRQNGLLHSEIQALKQGLEASKQADSERVEQLETQVKELTKHHDHWVLAHVEVTGRKKEVEEKARKLEEQLNHIEETHKQELDQLQRQFEAANSRAHSAEQSLFTLEGDHKGALAREEDLRIALRDTKRDLQEKLEELQKQQSEFAVKARSLKEIHLERQKYDDEISALQQTLIEHKDQIRGKEFIEGQALEEKAKLEALLLTKQSELEALQLNYDRDLKGLEELNVQLAEARDEVTSLKEQVQSLQLVQNKGLQESETHQAEMALIAEQLSLAEQNHQKEKANLESEVEKAKTSEQMVQAQLTAKETALDELQSRLESTERELREKIVDLEKDLRSKEHDLSQRDQELVAERKKVQELMVGSDALEEEKVKLESSLAALRRELELAERATQSSKEEVTEHIRQLQVAEQNSEKLQSKLAEAKSKEREAMERLAIADESIPELKKTSERYHRELQSSQQEVTRLTDLLAGKEDELAEAKIRENSLSSSISAKNDRVRELEQAEIEFRREVEKANQRTQEKQQKVTELSQKVDDQSRSIEKLTRREQQLMAEKAMNDSKVIQLQDSIQLIKQEREEVRQKLLEAERSLRSGSDAAEFEKTQWESQVRESRSRVAELESRLKETEKKRDHFQSESDALARDRDQVNRQLHGLQVSVESLKSQHSFELERLTETNQGLDQQLRESQEEVRKTKLELSHKDSTLEQKEQSIEWTNKQLLALKNSLEESQARVLSLESDATALGREYDGLELEVKRLTQERDQARTASLKQSEELSLLQGSLEKAEINLKSLERQLNDEQNQKSVALADLKSQIRLAEENKDHFKILSETAEEQSKILDTKVAELEALLRGSEKEARSLQVKVDDLNISQDRALKEAEELKVELKTLTDQSRQAASIHTFALQEKELANQQLVQSLEKEQYERDQEKQKLEEAVNNLEQERNSLQSRLAELQVASDHLSDSDYESDAASADDLSEVESVSSTALSDLFSDQVDPSAEDVIDLTQDASLPKWTDLRGVVLEVKSEEYTSLGPGSFVIPSLIQKLSTAWSDLASGQELIEKEQELYHFTSPEHLPGKSSSRKAVILLHEQFLKELKSIGQAYQKARGLTSDGTLADDFTREIERIKALTQDNIQILARRQDDFQDRVDRFEASLEALKPDAQAGPEDPEVIVDSGLTSISTVLAKNPEELDREFYTHALCAIARSASERLNESWKKKVATIREPDEGHRALRDYEYSLQRMLPEHLPPRLGRSVPEHGRVFLAKLLGSLKTEFEVTLDEQLGGGHKTLADLSLEERMVRDPQICHSLLTLLSSLQEQHEGIVKQLRPSKLAAGATRWVDFDYADASLVGLSQIRDEFQLPATPTMTKVLKTIQRELKRPGSLVLTMAVRQHRENYNTEKERDTRRRKLEKQCTELLAQETRLDPKQKYRGVTHDVHLNQPVGHPHQAEIACFQPDSPVPLLDVSEHVQTQAGFRHSALTQNPDCLINSFMNGFNKMAVHKTSLVTGDQYVELSEGAQCQPSLVFHSKAGKHWQIQLDGRTWSVDPAFLHEHPNYRIPFQVSTEGREKKRDWIPLKSASGQIVILVAQKTPSDQQCFMYELGSNNQLIPVPIQGENPRAELIKANLLSKACLLETDSPTPSRARKEYPSEVLELESLKNAWLPNVSLEQIDGCYRDVVQQVDRQLLKPPFTCSPCEGRVRSLPVELPVVRKVAQEKSRKPKTGAHQETFHPEQFSPFTVNASFGHVGQAFLKAKRELLDDSAHSATESIIKTLEGEQDAFQGQVFKNLSVYSGCELQTLGPRGMPDGKTLKINRQSVLRNFEKVIVNNRKHCVRTLQLKKALEKSLVSYIRDASEEDLQGFSDGELLDHAIRNFERGLAPGGRDVDGFIKRMSQLMLVDIDLEQSSLIGQQLEILQHELVDLDFAAFEQVSQPHEYIRRCQEWNLNMALLASRQSNLNNRISSYDNILLDTKNLALLSFERRHHIVLSADQAEELAVTLEGVSQWANGHEVAMLSHKGTGYGKSTLLLALTDHASAQLGSDTHRSVIVMAPKTNQAELDKGLREYYARKGQNYCRLNLETCFAAPAELSVARLLEVENILLGLPAATSVDDRQSLLAQGRVPVGASITDVQILMHLKQALLDAEGFIQDKQAILAKLDACLDLLRNSMVFADEFDSEMVPHTEAESISVAQAVQKVINGLGYAFEVEPRSINLKHSEFLFGCKARHLLSATLGTLYCAALASASGSVEEVRHKARTDPVTTNQRFWHFLSLAEPVFFSSSDPQGRDKMLTDVLHRVGPRPQIIFFDGAESGEESTAKAHQMSRTLNRERLAMGGVQKSVIYYDPDKNLQMQYQDDPIYGQGASASSETITQLRRSGGQNTDGYLSKAQSVGTDMPQGGATVGIFHGLVGQAGGEANENYLVQQLGRLIRDSKDLHKAQKVFMAVDLDAVEGIKGADKQKEAFTQALKALDDSMASQDNLFPEGIENASPALKKVIEQTVTFPIQKTEEGGKGYLERLPQIRNELAELGKKEWAELGLSQAAFQELVNLKACQWACKNAWLELVAVDVANRERSNHTLSCEQALQQARVNSHLDKVYAQEHHWLNNEAVSLVDNLDLKAAGIPAEAVAVVTSSLKSEVTNFLKSMDRRIVLPGTYQEDLLETADSEPMRERLSGYFEQLKSEGVRLDGKDMVSETNAKLIHQSDVALEEAQLKITELYNVVKKLGDRASGSKYFRDIIDSLGNSREKLKAEGGVQEAMKTEVTLQKAYQHMMEAVMKVVINRGVLDLAAIEKQMMAVITQCVDIDPALQLSLRKNTVGVTKIKAMDLTPPEDVSTTFQKFRWRKKGQQGQWTLIGNSRQAIMDCDVAKDHFSIKADCISNKSQLNSMQAQAASLKGRQTELNRAVKLCQHPVQKEFRDCVDEVERALMQQFGAFANGQKKITEREQQLMLRQSELRQSRLYKVLV